MMKSLFTSWFMAAVLSCTVSAADTQAERKGPLKDLPSPEGPHIAKIKAMGDNSWLELGQPSPDPKWGEGLGRAWSSKMPFAPNLRGAFLCGEGRHGGTATRNGKRYYNDDLFFYDINAHRWICLHPGQELGKYRAKFNEDGLEVDKDGHPLPIAWMVHAYGGVTYDPDRREFLTCHNPAGGGYWRSSMPERLAFFEKHGESQYLPANRKKISLIPRMLTIGDVPDLAAALAPRPLRMDGLVDGFNRLRTAAEVRDIYRPAQHKYTSAGASDRLVIYDTTTPPAKWLLEQLRSGTQLQTIERKMRSALADASGYDRKRWTAPLLTTGSQHGE